MFSLGSLRQSMQVKRSGWTSSRRVSQPRNVLRFRFYSIALRVTAFVALVWIFVPSVRHNPMQTDQHTITQGQKDYWHVFGPPDLTAAEWEAACRGPWSQAHVAALSIPFYEGSTLSDCTAMVRCPPDCETFKRLREAAPLSH